jgi:hypothetical protein
LGKETQYTSNTTLIHTAVPAVKHVLIIIAHAKWSA